MYIKKIQNLSSIFKQYSKIKKALHIIIITFFFFLKKRNVTQFTLFLFNP